jgi:ABC-type uncharacterized transport system permease subunit
LGLAYVPADRHRVGLSLTSQVWENMTVGHLPEFSRGPILNGKAAKTRASELIRRFDVRGARDATPAGSLSGGNQQKVQLARELTRRARVIVAEQPSRGVDIGAIEAIHRILVEMRDAGRAVFVISADIDEIFSLSDRILVIYRGRIVADLVAEDMIGALFSGVVGYAVPMPAALHVPVCIAAAFLGGALWASVPALLRVFLSVNELVVCLMMNPIALLLTGYVAARALKAPGPTNKLPDILDTALLPNFSLFSQLNAGIFVALACCVIVSFVNAATVRGFEWKIIGLNPRFAYYGGMNVGGNALAVFLASGGVAGLAGAEQVLGVYKAFYDNFSPGYGFDGIAVAMLARNSPVGVIFAAFLLGAMNAGSTVLQMTTGVSKYLVQVLQFIIVLVLAAQFSLRWLTAPSASESRAAKMKVRPGDRPKGAR